MNRQYLCASNDLRTWRSCLLPLLSKRSCIKVDHFKFAGNRFPETYIKVTNVLYKYREPYWLRIALLSLSRTGTLQAS